MDRVFLDANVLFSAAYREGNGMLRLWRLPRVTLLSSPYAVEEARRNLGEAAQRTRLAALVDSIEQVPTLSSQPLVISLPEKDQPIFRAALSGRATHLITGDGQHFGSFYGHKVMGILVLRPADYLKR